jgi:PAS domain S-box-containing protein
MRNFRDVSIKLKLTLIIMLTSSVVLLLACAAFVIYDLITFRHGMTRALSTIAEIIGSNSTSALVFVDQDAAEETLAALNAEPHIVSCYIYDVDGGVFAKYLRSDVKGERSPPLEPREDSYRFEDNHLLLFQRIVLDDEPIGTVYIRSDMQELYSRLNRYAGIGVIIMLASSSVAVLLSSRLRRVISEPILRLAQTMRVVSTNKDYSIRASKYSEDEVGLLIDGFNEMLAQIQARDEALRESEEMYRTIFETTGTAAIMVEEDTTISLANAEFEELSGYSKEEIEGKKSWTQFIPEDRLEKLKEYHRLRRIDPDAAPTNYEAQFIHREGDIRDCLLTVTMIPGTEKSIGFIVDITERKEETERIQTAKMESLRELVAGVTHRMNNPIGVISSNNDVSSRAIGKIEEMITDLGSPSPRRGKEGSPSPGSSEEHLREIKQDGQLVRVLAVLEKMNQVSQTASEEIAKIVANLQRFVRLDEAEWQFADIHEGMDNVIALMDSELSSRIRVTKDYGDIPTIYSSPSSLNQVFMSLFKNASEAIEGKGEIRLRTFAQGEHVKIEVNDTGKGIPAEDMDRIFDPGFTTKGVRVGVGLGLPICYKIVVDEHKGRIDVSSELSKGTTFTITLPQHRNR